MSQSHTLDAAASARASPMTIVGFGGPSKHKPQQWMTLARRFLKSKLLDEVKLQEKMFRRRNGQTQTAW